MKLLLTTLLLSFSLPLSAFAWDGYDWETSSYIEIEDENLVRSGEDIDIYDWGAGSYNTVEVQSVKERGSSVEVEVYDYDTGEYHTLDMEQ